MSEKKSWSRRNFVQVMGTAALGSRGVCSTIFPSVAPTSAVEAAFLYVGCAGGVADAIDVFASQRGSLTRIQRVPSERPVSMAQAMNGRQLYVVNEVGQYRGLPRGTVEAYGVGDDGRLTLLNRQELSLAATMPRHVAVTPDGSSLIVTAQGGGVFNTMPIAEDGSVGRASGILKVTGDDEGRQAQLQMTIFDRADRIVSVDKGTGRLRVLRTNQGGLALHSHAFVESKGSPRHIALHHETGVLYVAHEHSLECYGYDHQTGQVTEMRQQVADAATALAVHPSGRLLLGCDAANGIATWKTGTDGTLCFAGRHAEELGRLAGMDIAHDGASLVAINSERGMIASATVDGVTGRVSGAQMLARVDSPQSVAVIYR